MAEVVERFPLFPLGLVLLPSEVVPLHIFEERYKTMIGVCLDDEREFGLLWLAKDGLRDVGCAASVAQLLERMPDGRMNILVEGTRPLRLLRRVEDLPYPAGQVELLEDEPAAAGAAGGALAEARERYADLIERVTDKRPEDDDLAGMGAYRMAATVEIPLAAKQELLELRSEEARLRRVAQLFAEILKGLDFAERAGEVAKSNGRVRH